MTISHDLRGPRTDPGPGAAASAAPAGPSGEVAGTIPQTAEQYVRSLQDERTVFIGGERVQDITTHPAFRNVVGSMARLYDDFHHAGEDSPLRVPTDTGTPGVTHPFFTTARSSADLHTAREAITAWQRPSLGWLGRSPDYKASFFGTLDANADFYGGYADNARRLYRETQHALTYWSHAVVNPPVDRMRPADRVADIAVHVEEETAAGIVVSGAKVVATAAAITQSILVGHLGQPVRDRRFGLVFTAPIASPGLSLLCRFSYEQMAAASSTPFDHPLSSRFDENDSIVVFDKVLVPWENVLAYDADVANRFGKESGFTERFLFHGCTRLAVKLDFLVGAVLRAVEVIGTSTIRGVEVQLGELISWRDLFWGLSEAMVAAPEPWRNGAVQPSPRYGAAYRTFMGQAYGRVREIIQQLLGSSLIYLNSSAADWQNPEIRRHLDTYLRGTGGVAAVDRVKLLKLIWDAVGSEFAGRHELYERNYSGDHETVRLQALQACRADGRADQLKGMVEDYLGQYDLDGWHGPDFR